MNEWEKLQEENEARQPVEIKRRVEAAEAEVRIMHEVKNLLVGLAIIAAIVIFIGWMWAVFGCVKLLTQQEIDRAKSQWRTNGITSTIPNAVGP